MRRRIAMRGLVLDIGGVVIRTPFELLESAERQHGLAVGALGPRGPFDPDGDEPFARVLAGELAERAYWAQRAAHAASVLGTSDDTRAFLEVLFELPPEQVVRPEVAALVADAATASRRIGLLTNDLRDFHGDGWLERLPIAAHVDVLVDGSVTGVLKPDARAFGFAVEAMGMPAEDLVFADDQPGNVAGGLAAGLRALHFDVTAPADSVAAIRTELELP